MNEEKKPMLAMLLVVLIAVGGLIVLFDNSITGALSGQQTAYSRIYGLRYHQNPCALLDCHWGGKTAVAVDVDPSTGTVVCMCPEHSMPYYQISHWTKQ
ncbi:MAG: hypothetical protein QW666_00460 [Candidatus Woesearchaeota archaeon]